jgi:hypothetical protein
MANQPEISDFTAGVYQWEVTDPAEAGPGGIMNAPLLALANRTRWLKDQLAEETAARQTADTNLQNALNLINKHIPKNRGYFSGLNVSLTTGSLTVSGDITSAIAVALTGDSVITVTMANAMPSTNYFVRAHLQSLRANINDDDDICAPAFKPITTTVFTIAFREMEAIDQNLRVHLEVVSLD